MSIAVLPNPLSFEQGSWTPGLQGATTNPTVTYGANNSGSYTKIGNMVLITGVLQISTVSGGSGSALVSGFPYAAGSTQANRGTMFITNSTGYTSTTTPTGLFMNASAQVAQMRRTATGDARDSANTAVTVAEVLAGSQIFFSGMYFTS